MVSEHLELPEFTPGVRRRIEVRRFGTPGARPKAYLQAALHADEIPPLLVAHHLTEMLAASERAGQVRGEVVLVPMANPVGLDQWVQGDLLGRTASVPAANAVEIQRRLRARCDVRQRDIAGAPGIDAQRHADELGRHRIERCRLGIDGHRAGSRRRARGRGR